MANDTDRLTATDHLTSDQLLMLLRSAASVARTGQWLSGKAATVAEQATCREVLTTVNAALLARGEQVVL